MPDPSDRDIVIRLAKEVLGWTFSPYKPGCDCEWAVDSQRFIGSGCDKHGPSAAHFNPLEAIADAYEMESKIPDHKRLTYLHRLRDSIGKEDVIGLTKLYWGFAHASPRQRCLAAVAMLEEK